MIRDFIGVRQIKGGKKEKLATIIYWRAPTIKGTGGVFLIVERGVKEVIDGWENLHSRSIIKKNGVTSMNWISRVGKQETRSRGSSSRRPTEERPPR